MAASCCICNQMHLLILLLVTCRSYAQGIIEKRNAVKEKSAEAAAMQQEEAAMASERNRLQDQRRELWRQETELEKELASKNEARSRCERQVAPIVMAPPWASTTDVFFQDASRGGHAKGN